MEDKVPSVRYSAHTSLIGKRLPAMEGSSPGANSHKSKDKGNRGCETAPAVNNSVIVCNHT